MRKKIISFILSMLLLCPITLNVKATEINEPVETLTDTEIISNGELKENIEVEKTNPPASKEVELEIPLENPIEENDKLVPVIESTYHPGEVLSLNELITAHLGDDVSIVNIETPIEEGTLKEEHIGQYEVHVNYEDKLLNQMLQIFMINITGIPVLEVNNTTLIDGNPFTLSSLGLKATDHEDGDLTDKIILKESPTPLEEIIDKKLFSSFTITLSVTDADGNEVSKDTLLTIGDKDITPQAILENEIIIDETKTISGANRFQTAVAISQAMYQTTDVVILVSATNFPDALAAGPLAKSMNAPILLTNADRLSSSTTSEIVRLGATKVVIMGGESAVSSSVEEFLKSKNLLVERIAGSNRYTTAIAAAEKLGFSSTVLLANGDDFADAMTAGSYASINKYPIILTKGDRLSSSVKTFLEDGVENILIIGGESAVSGNIEEELKTSGKTVTRIAGTNRFNTAVEMAKFGFSTTKTAVVSNGMNFVDALTAVPYAASLNLPILLANRDRINTGVKEYLVSNYMTNFHFIGGESALSAEVKNSMMYPSLYEISYNSADVAGTWLKEVKNGEPTGNLSGSGLSQFVISTQGDKDINIRYGVSLVDSGWQEISDSGSVGAIGKKINGLVMELKGTDAETYNVNYRGNIEGSGWSEWYLGGQPLGSSSGKPILSIEVKIVKGNALDISKSLFPNTPRKMTYAYTTAALNLREGEGSTYPIILQMQNRSYLEIISINYKNNWAKVNYTARGVVHEGFASMDYVKTETHVTNAIVTINGIRNGDTLPTSTIEVNGDAAYINGISEINYYINGTKIGNAEYGYLSSTSLSQGFDSPTQIGYRISIPASQWKIGTVNALKIEIVGKDGKKEWDVRYLNDNNKIQLVFEPYAASFNYYLEYENSKGSAVYGSGIASKDQIASYLDPSNWAIHDTYRYMFLDLGYDKQDYEVKVEQLDSILIGKGILSGKGSTFLQAAIDFNINPFYLIAHAILETGNGNSVLANGQQLESYHETFGKIDSALIPLSEEDMLKKWYNVFGIGAYDGNANLWGGERAYLEQWDTIEKAIYNGAEWIAKGYINRMPEPQNTNYKMRYNLKETMTHQYATDVMWAYKQAYNIKKQFDNMGFEVPLKFIIPTFGDIRP